MSSGPPQGEIRKTQETTSGEYIAENAVHWKAEAFIPATVSEMKGVLLQRRRADSAEPDSGDMVHRVFEAFTSILNHDYRNLHQQLELHYSFVDPDRDLKLISPPTPEQRAESTAQLLSYLDDVLQAANFTRLDESQIREAMDLASDWGVRLNVDFELFESLSVYCRGDVCGIRRRRDWRNWWRLSEFEVPIYQRLVAVYKLNADVQLKRGRWGGELEPDRLHLSLFKNIPQEDVDMLLPGGSIRFSWLDRTKIFAPTLGGIGMTIFKIVRGAIVIAATGLAAMYSIGLVVAGVAGYAARGVFSYFHTKDKYLLNMTRSLYFQKLDSNAGVVYRLLQEARQQDLMEVIIGYYALSSSGDPITPAQLQALCQRLLGEVLDIEIRFDVDTSLRKLRSLGIAIEAGGGTYTVLSPESAIIQLDHYWDNLVTASRTSPSQ